QTLTNCERFITEELKVAENTILGASDKVKTLEADIFCEIRDFVATQLRLVQETAAAIAMVDVLCSFATAAINNNYSKPEVSLDGSIEIIGGRHPVVELMQKDELFVPNDAYLNTTTNRMSIITGPNMSGKSTFMRQVALITLMTQIGSFVPADHARISVVDQIFTRIGASDDLTAGQSTFMVEMSEVADIVKHATKNSLVILDEVGRGTSTFDGIAIAKSVCEFISQTKALGCKTLFATHYHELIELEKELDGVKNFSVAVKRKGEDIIFLRKIVEGGADESYGIEVAKLAGLPNKIIKRSKELLEAMKEENLRLLAQSGTAADTSQLSFTNLGRDEVISRIKRTNIDEMTDEELREFHKELLKYL
ncbi:MAG: DNA mismatch repair protein MutS, partial [Ruminococcus sp.]|nr:DNA mismatch repair protein MutS [Ruminococcus sp.]